MNKKLVLALDVDNIDTAKTIIDELKDVVGVFKVGKQLFVKYGPQIVEYIHSKNGKVFLDLKFHDIPNTVAGAAKSATELGVFMFNVHAIGGSAMMHAAKESAAETASKMGVQTPIVLGVTVLTSISQEVLNNELKIDGSVESSVTYLANLAKQSGLNGVVASAKEIEILKQTCGKDFVVLTPGIRPAWAATNDQARIMTPKDAIDKGADYIVVGRPILHAENRVEAAQKIVNEIH